MNMDKHIRDGSTVIGSLFRMALINGVPETVLRQIRCGEDVNATDAMGMSPLMLAASRGHLEVCKLLLEAGADPCVRDIHGRSVLTIAKELRLPDIAALVAEHGEHTEPTKYQSRKSGEQDIAVQLSGWEPNEECNPAPVPTAQETLAKAIAVQEIISKHDAADDGTEWLDVDIDLPQRTSVSAKRLANAAGGYGKRAAASPKIRIREAANEITRSKRAPAALIDLMGHPATRGVNYRTIKAEYESWRRESEIAARVSMPAATVHEASSNAIFTRTPSGQTLLSDESLDKQTTLLTNVATALDHADSHGSSAKRLHSGTGTWAPGKADREMDAGTAKIPQPGSWAARLRNVADNSTALTGAMATQELIEASPTTRGSSPENVHTEFERWHAFRTKHGHGLVARSNVTETKRGSSPAKAQAKPARATMAGSIWAAADVLAKAKASPPGLTLLLRYPTLEGMNPQTVKSEFNRWRTYHGLAPCKELASPEPSRAIPLLLQKPVQTLLSPRNDKRASSRAPARSAEWDTVARYLADQAGLTVKDMRPMNGYFWVLVESIDTPKLRTMATKLVDLGFERIAKSGFRKK